MAGMKQILLMIAVVAVVGCSKDTPETSQAAEAEAQVTFETEPVLPAEEKLIADPIVEDEVRDELKKPEGELTEADLEKVTGEIGLSGTQITDAGLKDLAKLQNLTSLMLNGTKTSDEGLKEVAKLQQLEQLYLSNTRITDAGLKDVAKMQKLTILHLVNTKITDEGLKEVAKLQELEWLFLDGTQTTDEGLKEMAKLQKLERLDLFSTKITKAGVAELKKALPKCSILGP